MSATATSNNVPSRPQDGSVSLLSGFTQFIRQQSNFFRLHLCAFIFIPLIFSGIFYASNGRFRIRYIDSLFLCYSAMTDTGLSTVNLSTLTAWQQVILYILMTIGNTTAVSWIMVLVRKQYFRNKCHYVVNARTGPTRDRAHLLKSISSPRDRRINGDLIYPHDRDRLVGATTTPTEPKSGSTPNYQSGAYNPVSSHESPLREEEKLSPSSQILKVELPDGSPSPTPDNDNRPPTPASFASIRQRRVLRYEHSPGRFPQRTVTILSSKNAHVNPVVPDLDPKDKHQGLGEFPGPLQLIHRLFKRLTPLTYRKLERTVTVPSMTTLEKKSSKWLKFDGLVVGRNSDFRTETLTDDQLEEIGGTEYRALRLLSYLIPSYFVATQLFSFILFAPWLSVTKEYDSVFDNQYRLVQKPWYSMFVITSAYTGTGLDLVDLSMLPFQQAYLMIFSLIFILLAGNHALPIFLRLIIWIGSRLTREGSEADETLSFLLHHPRRCFMLLFPSLQTWFLLIVLVGLSSLEWAAFGILNIGLDVFQSLPTGPRVISGLFQGIAVRASGLTIVPISSLAPALLFLYVVLMYIAVYPVAMCIRATNVYEERSLGIFEAPVGDITENLEELEPRERVGRYLSWHLRRQLAMDIWWLIWGIFLVAVIERNSLMDTAKPWFNLFTITFELVSAFSGIGLSLGFPNDNYSFVGAARDLSKLVVIVLMIQGRHRGLPVAVDRAVLLPSELVVNGETTKSGALHDPSAAAVTC